MGGIWDRCNFVDSQAYGNNEEDFVHVLFTATAIEKHHDEEEPTSFCC